MYTTYQLLFSLLSHLAGQNHGGRPVDRPVLAGGEPYGDGEIYLQHLLHEMSSMVGDVHGEQWPNIDDHEEGVLAARKLHG